MADDRTLAERVEAVQRWLEPFVLSGAAKAAEHAEVLRNLQAELPKWQPIDTAPSGEIILIHYRNSHGKSRVIKARHVKRWTEETSVDFEEGCGEYSEELDAFFITEGWWEQVDNWPDYTEIVVSEGEPIHWQPLPAPPSEGE